MPKVNQDPFTEKVFRAPPERSLRFVKATLAYVPPRPVRILDIGCGTGDELLHLVETLHPESSGIGVDISKPNIELAETARVNSPAAGRLRFLAADYLTFAEDSFDVIISDSTLQNIPSSSRELFSKIFRDLNPNGVLVCSLPYNCGYNRFLWMIRRGLRLVRSRWTDRLIYAAGKIIDGGKASPELLWDRVHYMYLLPHTIFEPKLTSLLSGLGLELAAEIPIPWASVAQPKHRLFVFRKT